MPASPSHGPGPGWLGLPVGGDVRSETHPVRGRRDRSPHVATDDPVTTAGPGLARRSGSAVTTGQLSHST